ncbi:hypothetical protein J6590_044944 [Homalodisca vitripennis]|nr:hypothetical protein J6590_044944 [Homalodisca vitripennis]
MIPSASVTDMTTGVCSQRPSQTWLLESVVSVRHNMASGVCSQRPSQTLLLESVVSVRHRHGFWNL